MKRIVLYYVILGDVKIPFIKKTEAEAYMAQPHMVGAVIDEANIIAFESVDDYKHHRYNILVQQLSPSLSLDDKHILGFME